MEEKVKQLNEIITITKEYQKLVVYRDLIKKITKLSEHNSKLDLISRDLDKSKADFLSAFLEESSDLFNEFVNYSSIIVDFGVFLTTRMQELMDEINENSN